MSESHNSFVYTGALELDAVEKNLIKYNKFIIEKFINHSRRSKIVLDFGAGIGTLSNIWRKLDHNVSITCFELDKRQINILKERGFLTINSLNSNPIFDYIFSSNVLEHIENDQAALDLLFGCLRVGGRVGIFVPANQILYSHIDKKIEHFRRYSKEDLVNKVKNSGFKIDQCTYVDTLGFFAWGLAKILSLNIADENSKKLNFYDKIIWPISKILDTLGFKFLFGKNLLLLATKE
jgi:SAM-dependent methyltransferase